MLLNGDCAKEMAYLVDTGIKVDLVVTSPPYDNLRDYDNLKWDELKWKNIISLLYQIVKDSGVVVWVVGDATIDGDETGTSFKQALWFKKVGFKLHDTMIFAKNNPIPIMQAKRYNPSFEYMFIFVKGKIKTFNAMKRKKYYKRTKKTSFRQKNGTMREQSSLNFDEDTMQNNIWFYNVGSKPTEHPAVFPEQLAKDHIYSWSNKGDIILDPFMGSGTTGVACYDLQRQFIGIEISKTYFEMAKERINKAKQQLLLNL